MGLFGAAKADPKKQVNEMSQLLRPVVDSGSEWTKNRTSPDGYVDQLSRESCLLQRLFSPLEEVPKQTKCEQFKSIQILNCIISTTGRRETRAIERQIRDIERQQQKTTQMLKQNAKKGDKEACRILG